ncbi:MAG: alginate export family protein [Bacteroidota bacterium]
MKNYFTRHYLWLGLLLLSSLGYQLSAQFTLSAEVRPRSEFRNGFKTPTTEAKDPVFFTEQRSRLYLDYSEEKYKFRVSFQDVRYWGETPQIFKEENGNTFINEAWGQYFLSDKFSIKAGRQMISYDNQRFLGGLEWAQQGRRHDALLFIYEDKEAKSKLHLGLAYNSDDDVPEFANLQNVGANFYSVGGNYKSLQYAWFNKKFDKGSLYLLALNAGIQQADSTVSNKQTFGAIPRLKLSEKLSIGADVYYQTGKLGNNNVDALLAGFNATLKTKLTPITLGVEYISGKDDSDNSSTITNFNPDYGTNHAFNGFMDYFFVGPANGNVGVTDFYVKTKFPLKKGALILNVHEFFTGSEQLDNEGQALSSAMGTEIDLVYALKLSPGVSFNIGYSQMLATDTMLALRPGDQKMNSWAWTMITFKPTLFKSEKENK